MSPVRYKLQIVSSLVWDFVPTSSLCWGFVFVELGQVPCMLSQSWWVYMHISPAVQSHIHPPTLAFKIFVPPHSQRPLSLERAEVIQTLTV